MPCPPKGNVKGVDSTASSHEALDAAKAVAAAHGCIVAVSGATDLVRAPAAAAAAL
jgi:hydroxyethylthiazole kinase-like sugar kinase family protein